MSVTVRLFAAAREALGTAEAQAGAGDLAGMLAGLAAGLDRPARERWQLLLASCTVLVDGVRTAGGSVQVADGAQVEVLPPFAGG